ncbi:MAG: peptide chain release factor 3 [Solirubrobacteraceae bacterium]
MTAHAAAAAGVGEQAARRRTFAIISHPDAGKTTLTEKLLLYAGAVAEAGTVKARQGRRTATSDWMELERRRGISISSTVLRFEHAGLVFNLLDTPGHRDFSEDTLRVLAAVDCAVMLLDAAKGVEPQTRRLFEVARERGIPLIAFVNKYDRPGLDPLEMLDHLERTLGLAPAPVTWPVGIPGDFRGVVDRRSGAFHRFTRTARGAGMAPEELVDPVAAAREEGAAWVSAREELELLDAVGDPSGTPVFFGSASWNFGVRLLLDALGELAPAAAPRRGDNGPRPVVAPFSGLIFKVQANMDPRHRDRIAFLRVCSGRFERGMRAINARTGRPFALSHAHELFGQDRTVLDSAYPGDVVGLVNAGDLLVGDTLFVDDPVRFARIPVLAPEHFRTVHNRDTGRHKQFRRGLSQLDEEGVIHLLRREYSGDPVPIIAGVGPMQFEVATERLRGEFGVDVRLEPMPWGVARRTDAAGARTILAQAREAEVLVRSDGTQLALFRNEYMLASFADKHPDVVLDRFLIRDDGG